MSQAEELLNSVSETTVEHSHAVSDSDTYFIIDPNTRQIENTNRKKTVIMQYDHNSERFTFQLPRYIDGHDMTLCTSVVVNFDNVETETGHSNSDVCDMTKVKVNPNDTSTVITSWLITRNSTQLAGTLNFSIEFKCVDANGEVVYEWSTDTFTDIEIKARNKNSEAAIVEHTDLLEQWRTKIFGAGDSVMANIASEGNAQIAAVQAESVAQQEVVELKGMESLESIPEDYTEVNNMAEESVRSKGDAIICEAEGEIITVNDSSNDYIRGLKVFGKSTQTVTNGYQLFDASILATISKGGATITNNGDGSFAVSGSGILTENIATLKDYTHEESLRMLKLGMLYCPLEKTMPYCYVQIRNSSEIYFGLTHSRQSYEITQAILDDEDMFIRIGFYGGGEEEIVPGTVKPMLYQDGDGTWEPFTGGMPSPNPDYPQEIVSIENPMVNICGKNLLENKANTKTENGITFNINNDKSITINGTSTVTPLIVINSSSPICYHDLQLIASLGCDNEAVHMAVGYFGENEEYVDSLVTISSTEDMFVYPPNAAKMRVYIFVSSNVTFDNVTVYPMIRLADNPDSTYEPYIELSSITPTHTLPGIPVTSGGNYTDENGQQWICDEVDLERGVLVKRCDHCVFDGSDDEVWDYEVTKELFKLSYLNLNKEWNVVTNTGRSLMLHYGYDASIWNETVTEYGYCINFDSLFIRHKNIMSLDSFKEHIAANPIELTCVMSEPIETPLTAEEITAFKALRTNYPNTTILNDAGAWMSVKYNADTKTYIDEPKVLKLVDSSTGVVYELKIVNGSLTVVQV